MAVPGLGRATDSWPSKPVRLVVPFAPGGVSEIVASTTDSHLAMEYLKMVTEIVVLHVSDRGTGQQLTDLLAGRLDAASVGAPAVMQFTKTGKLRCLATGTPQRIAQLPDVPNVAEQGWPGFEMTQWYGLLAPASMPQATVDRLDRNCCSLRRRCAGRVRQVHRHRAAALEGCGGARQGQA
jgi:tripartite-type tricarboxylate transporter receptor subunit TctC